MVSPSFAIRDPRGRTPFPSRSRLCRSARGARVDILRLVRGNSDNFKTERGSMGTNRRFTTRQKHRERSRMGKQYGRESRITARCPSLSSSPVRRIIFGGHSSAREGRSPPRTRAEGPVRQRRTPTPRALHGRHRADSGCTPQRTTASRQPRTGEKTCTPKNPSLRRGGSSLGQTHADELDRSEIHPHHRAIK